MDGVATIWIDRGTPVPGLDRNPFPNLDMPFRYYGLVEITRSDWGTAIRWDPQHAKRESVLNVVDRLGEWQPPYTLIYYKQGWFTETIRSPDLALNRILYIQTLDNVQILSTTHVKNFPVNDQTLLPWLRAVHRNPDAFRDYAVEDVVDDSEGTFQMNFVGTKSPFRQYIFAGQDHDGGLIPGNEPWIRRIESAYLEVLDAWEPRLDHVVASVNSHEGEPVWHSWHRMVIPTKNEEGRFGVRCLVAMAPVDITVI